MSEQPQIEIKATSWWIPWIAGWMFTMGIDIPAGMEMTNLIDCAAIFAFWPLVLGARIAELLEKL